ncbi:hypothetical protein GD429_16160 [Burkholderia sp. BE17]|nr:hypothetical protein [Burkholderia sp. BE17]
MFYLKAIHFPGFFTYGFIHAGNVITNAGGDTGLTGFTGGITTGGTTGGRVTAGGVTTGGVTGGGVTTGGVTGGSTGVLSCL